MTRRVRGAFATLGSAPWRRAPWLLRGRPGVLATVAGACAVLAAALAAVPLFESSVGSAAIDVQVAERCPRDTGVTLPWVNTPRAEGTPSVEPLAPLADRLGPAVRWISTPTEVTGADPADPERVVLLARDGALDHVDVLEGTPGPGLWITDRAARLTGLGVGDQAVVGGVPMDVAGVYRDLFATPLDSYWCAHGTLFESRGPDAPPLPPVVILDRETMESVQIAPRLILGGDAARAIGSAWEAPLRPDVTLSEADALVDELACTGEQWAQLEWCAEGRPALTAGAAGPAVAPNRQGDEFVTSYLESSLPFVVQRTQAIQTAVAGGVWPVAGFAALAGAGLVAAAGSLWFDRRRREVALLTVRGVAPAGLGLKAVLELGVALVTGSAAGVALAYGLVAWRGSARHRRSSRGPSPPPRWPVPAPSLRRRSRSAWSSRPARAPTTAGRRAGPCRPSRGSCCSGRPPSSRTCGSVSGASR